MEILIATLIVGLIDILISFIVAPRKRIVRALALRLLKKIKSAIRTKSKESKEKRYSFRRTLKKSKPVKNDGIEEGFLNMLKFK